MKSCIPIISAFLAIFFAIVPCISSLPSSANSSNVAEDAFLVDWEGNEEGLIYDYYNVPDTIGGMVEASLEWPLAYDEQDEEELRRSLQLSDDCVEDGPYFYNIDISISPGNTNGNCWRPHQILLGHDLNLLLLRIGLGERTDGDNILSMGGVCPKPDSGYAPRRMLRGGEQEEDAPTDDSTILHRELGYGFVYRGGFSCGWFCTKDDRDARRKLLTHDCTNPNNWLSCYITQVTRTLEATIRTQIAPKYPECLGANPNIDVTMTRKSFSSVNKDCGNEGGEIKEFLESFNLGDFYITTNSRVTCEMCNSLDFAQTANGASIDQAYIDADTWQSSHGVHVSARAAYGGGYTPGNKARAFNANKQTSLLRDMRTPNENCQGGGPGRGTAGKPGQGGENCLAVGNVLVINRWNKNEPEPNPLGGIITFQFDNPVLFADIGIIDADGAEHRINFKYADGTSSAFTYRGFGNNGLQRVLCNQAHVIQVDVIFRETAGITEINFCEHCTTLDSEREKRSKLISMEDFEDATPLRNWYNGRVRYGGSLLTTFLGRLGQGRADPYKTYLVPADATSLTVSLDLYQIDSWDFAKDTVTIYVGPVAVNLGNLRTHAVNGDRFSGVAGNGIKFLAKKIKEGELGFTNYDRGDLADKIWRVELEIPGGVNRLYGSGWIKLKFHANLSSSITNEALGIDNIKVVANNDCQSSRQLYYEDFEGTRSNALSGWTNGNYDSSQQTSFSKYLGRYARGSAAPSKGWNVPVDADMIAISFDLYQFDSWDHNDYVRLMINRELIHFGHLKLRSEGEETGGRTSIGLTWQAKLTGGGHLGHNSNFEDHIIHIDVQVPGEAKLYDTNGVLGLEFIGYTSSGSDEGWGWDNIEISVIELCSGSSETTHSSPAPTPPTNTCSKNDFLQECTKTSGCQNKYGNSAYDCNNGEGGVCFCGSNEVCGCL